MKKDFGLHPPIFRCPVWRCVNYIGGNCALGAVEFVAMANDDSIDLECPHQKLRPFDFLKKSQNTTING